ncbi:hypothetical protein [Lactococcus petauri]|nr:hypothetical protein [Lactococcus petauri]
MENKLNSLKKSLCRKKIEKLKIQSRVQNYYKYLEKEKRYNRASGLFKFLIFKPRPVPIPISELEQLEVLHDQIRTIKFKIEDIKREYAAK